MHRTSIKASFICAALAFSGATYAGLTIFNPVALYTDTGGTPAARGALRDARNSADSLAYIGCWVFASTFPVAQCVARDATGTFLSCVTTNPAMMQAAGSINPSSFVRFVLAPDGSSCDSVQVLQISSDL